MKNVANTIEDLLEILAGLQGQSKMQIESSDANIMYSIARQTFKGTALTDRQFALMKEKLQTYKNQFTELEYDFDRAVDSLRTPLRHIDRSKYIKVVSTLEMVGIDGIYESYKQDWKWIKIRFPFSKATISLISELSFELKNDRSVYHHEKGSHEHYFSLTELSAYCVVERFQNKNFEIEPELIDIYKDVNDIISNQEKFIPGVYNNIIKNLPPSALDNVKLELGDINEVSNIKLVDRHRRFGIEFIDSSVNVTNLTEEIATRKDIDFLCKPSAHKSTSMLEAVYNLDRFPLLVVIDDADAENQLYECYNFFRHLVPSGEQSVLFRQTNGTVSGSSFNQYVKDNNLNNWVDRNTKVVYINNNKIPKLLINNEWNPIASIVYGGNVNRLVDSYIKSRCDLIIFRDEYPSPMRKYSRFYG